MKNYVLGNCSLGHEQKHSPHFLHDWDSHFRSEKYSGDYAEIVIVTGVAFEFAEAVVDAEPAAVCISC